VAVLLVATIWGREARARGYRYVFFPAPEPAATVSEYFPSRKTGERGVKTKNSSPVNDLLK